VQVKRSHEPELEPLGLTVQTGEPANTVADPYFCVFYLRDLSVFLTLSRPEEQIDHKTHPSTIIHMLPNTCSS